MRSYHYGNPEKANTWEYAASIFAAHESVNSEKTSSLPLVQFWKPNVRFSENRDRCVDGFFKACKIEDIAFDSEQAEFSFEYPVPAQRGRGKASMTDLMITTNKLAMAIEAKWTECRENYKPTIEKWLKEGKNLKNRESVLSGWLDYINKFLPGGKHLDIGKINCAKIPYQFLHRVASACYVAALKKDVVPVVAYQLFYDDGNNGTEDHMKKFSEELKEAYRELFDGDAPVRFNIIKVKTEIIDNDVIDTIRGSLSERRDAFNDIFMIMQEEDVYRFLSIDSVFLARNGNY